MYNLPNACFHKFTKKRVYCFKFFYGSQSELREQLPCKQKVYAKCEQVYDKFPCFKKSFQISF